MRNAVALLDSGQEVVKAVLVLTSKHVQAVCSLERDGEVMVGSHSLVTDDELPQIITRLDNVVSEWTTSGLTTLTYSVN